MADFTPSNTYENLTKLAGRSDARQVRQVLDMGNMITFDKFPFLTFLGGKAVGTDGKETTVKPMIQSDSVFTLTPELYDDEVSPTEFRLTSDTTGMTVGSVSTFALDTTAGIEIGDTLKFVNQGIVINVVTVASATSITATVVLNNSGGTTATSDVNVRYLQKTGNNSVDGPTGINGTNREPTNRTNNLNFGLAWMAIGPLQKNLKLYNEAENNQWKKIQKMKLIDMNRNREGQFIGGLKASVGTGSSRILYGDGLEGWAASVFNNTTPDGTLSYDDFSRGLMPKAMSGGGQGEIWGLCGNDVAVTFSSYVQKQFRATNATSEYGFNVKKIECPQGTLNLIPSEYMNTEARRGQLITFNPKLLRRAFLNNMDLALDTDLMALGTAWVDRAAYSVAEALMASNPKAITLHTNILR
jgi:hypothetical protein